jgi:uncharacterized protein (DUF58 family)
MEFDEVRAYQEFDDARTIDWRVTARRGRPHTKLFREERERPVQLLVDLHPGMYFGSRRQFKSVLAGRLASLLGWAAMRAGDRVGGLVTGQQGHREIPPAPRERGLLPLLQAMVRLQPEQPGHWIPGRLDHSLARLARITHPASLVMILSDFRELGEGAAKHLGSLARHNDIIAAFVYDPLEAVAPPPGRYRLGDGTRRLTLDTGAAAVSERWATQFQDHYAAVHQLCRRHAIHFMQATTPEHPLRALQVGLARHNK